ncbi:MAG: hypothetical protein MK188_02480 [Gammaproteobacteria bacterium]|nr:hypothetical protein [Gammaproteobacteria bacterium]
MNTNQNKERQNATNENHLLRSIILACLAMLLIGCTSNRIVVTSDDSVDYKSAKSLPPLIKPEDLAEKPAVLASPSQQSEVEVEEGVDSDPAVSAETLVVANEDEGSPITGETDNDSVVTNSEETASTSLADSVLISTSLVSKGATTRLQINSRWDPAWDYLVDQLNSSGLTVFSRNKTAGRIAIGCGDIEHRVKVTRSGGWSIFNRKSEKTTEYCSLQMKDEGDIVLVSVLDRAGNEVPQKESDTVLSGLTKN